MPRSPTLNNQQIIDAAEEALRRFGPGKASVVDVARSLGVSHGTVYRYFAKKLDLWNAVAARWLRQVAAPGAAIAAEQGPAIERIERWFQALLTIKRRKAAEDPELFATFHTLAMAAHEVVTEHLDHLTGQLESIIADGVATGELRVEDPAAAARALFYGTALFHNPVHAEAWKQPDIDHRFREVFGLLLAGLCASQPDSDATTTTSPERARRAETTQSTSRSPS
ncbi:MAG: TetR family transcriptional regulator [Myxococcota bacterium]